MNEAPVAPGKANHEKCNDCYIDNELKEIAADASMCWMCASKTYEGDRVRVRNITYFCFECIDLLNRAKLDIEKGVSYE